MTCPRRSTWATLWVPVGPETSLAETSQRSSSSTVTGAAGPAERQPSPTPNGLWSRGDVLSDHPGREHCGHVVVGEVYAVRVAVEPAGVDVGVAELVARSELAQEPGVGGQADHGGVVERGDELLACGLPGRAVHDDLAEHRVVRRADGLSAGQGLVVARAAATSARTWPCPPGAGSR